MIVCNLCGDAVGELGSRCLLCSGKGIEKATPLKSLLTPTQRKGSPDRWARRYTTPPGRTNGSPLAGTRHSQAPSTLASLTPATNDHSHVDFRLEPEAELARVCGTVFDAPSLYPHCALCLGTIQLGGRLYIAPFDVAGVKASDSTCRSCYAKLFAIGKCAACTREIVGDREEGHRGAHVKGRGASMWHASCFLCSFCKGALYRQDHLLTPSGQPACVSCFDQSLDSPPPKVSTVSARRSYARPRSLLSASHVVPSDSQEPSRSPKLPQPPKADILAPKVDDGPARGAGSVLQLAARFDATTSTTDQPLRYMKQSIAELDAQLGHTRV